jgi:branched-subunit amino acid transport protein
LNEQFSYNYNYNNKRRNRCLLRNINLRLDNFFILVAVIIQSLFYNQKRKDLVKNQWFVIGIITIFVIVISNTVIATLVRGISLE